MVVLVGHHLTGLNIHASDSAIHSFNGRDL